MEKEKGMKRKKKREKIEGKEEERMNGKSRGMEKEKVRIRRNRREGRRKTGKEKRKVCGGEGSGKGAGTDSVGIKSTSRKDDG